MMEKFEKIKQEYDSFYKGLLMQGRLPLKDTGIGFWAIAPTDDIINLFEKIDLKRFSHILDMGSGDGKVAIIASLFTRSSGIEYDSELHSWAVNMKHKLKSKAVFYNDDFMKTSLKSYDLIFLNPDKSIQEIETKLRNEFKGTLIVFGDEFLPFGLKKVDEFIASTTPVHVYSVE